MSLVEENLPGVGRVKKDFQVREDHVIAKQLQEREYEEHFDANVQSRRTAMKDAQVAKSFQASEMNSFKQEEGIRREQLRQQEERDREAAERYVQSIQEQEQRDIEARRKDEEVVQRLHREEMEREAQRKRQEEEDNRLALQHAQENEAIAKRRQEELARGEQEAKRLQQMEASKKPSGSADLPSYESLGFSLPPPPPTQPDEQEEEYVDESAQQEEEDARLAREMMEREEREAQRRRREQELADIEMARRLQQMESKGGAAAKPKTAPTSDADIARRMELEAREQQRRMNAQLQADEELAQRMKSDLIRQHSEQEMTDWELAKKLQKAEIVAHKKAAQTRGGGAGGGAMHSSFSHSSHPSTNSPTQSLPATLTANGQHRSQDGATVRPVYEDRPSDSPRGVQAYKRQMSAGKEGKKGKGKK